MENFRANCDEFTKNKDKGTDLKCKLNYRGNLNEQIQEKIKLSNGKSKENSQVLKRDRIKEIFNSLQVQSMVDPSILLTEAYKMIKEDYEAAITYMCNVCWKFEHRQNVYKFMFVSFF